MIEGRKASEHTESMLGAIDEFMARIATGMGAPYSMNGDQRLRLRREREQQRVLDQGSPDENALVDENEESALES